MRLVGEVSFIKYRNLTPFGLNFSDSWHGTSKRMRSERLVPGKRHQGITTTYSLYANLTPGCSAVCKIVQDRFIAGLEFPHMVLQTSTLAGRFMSFMCLYIHVTSYSIIFAAVKDS